MGMKPLIIVGCGGSGGKVVVALRNQLETRLRNSGWTEGIPQAWQLLFVDTPGSQETYPEFGPPVPNQDYVSVSQGQPVYKEVDKSVMKFLGRERWKNVGSVGSWRPSPDITLPVDQGAGQWRAVGRMAALSSMKSVSERIKQATTNISQGTGQFARLSAHLGDSTAPDEVPFVIVISSLAGGTGAGIFLDVCDVIRASNPQLQNRILGVLFTAEIFQGIALSGLEFNTVGAMSEMMASYMSPQQPFPEIFRGAFSVASAEPMRRGVNYPFLVGMKTLQGNTLNSTSDAYKSVTETLTSILLNPTIQLEFTQYLITNWGNEQDLHTSRWAMHNNLPGAFDAAGQSDSVFNGVVSSLGSARLSVGSQMFAEYGAHRLARAAINFLDQGFLIQGRTALGDNAASEEQILRFYRERDGLKFLELCGLREVNEVDKEWNQVLETLLPDEELNTNRVSSYRQKVEADIAQMRQKLITEYLSKIPESFASRKDNFLVDIRERLNAGEADFIANAPGRMLSATSQVMARDGIQVANAMVRFAREQIEQAIIELEREINTHGSWLSNVGNLVGDAFKSVPDKKGATKIDGSNDVVKKGIKAGSNDFYWTGRIEVRRRAIEVLKRFDKDVVGPLLKQLEQIGADGKNLSALVSEWPTEGGVPTRFAPSPLDFCLLKVEEWPRQFDALLSETVARDGFTNVDPTEYVRGLVGGGSFNSEGPSLDIKSNWVAGHPVQFETHLGIDDYLRRARSWIGRQGTPFGDFCNLNLWEYLKETDQSGNPVVDHAARISRFQDQLFATLERTQPLIHVDQPTFTSVHNHSSISKLETRIVPEKLPFPPESNARRIAEEVLYNFKDSLPDVVNNMNSLFSDSGKDCEGVLYVSRLKGAIHPAAVASLTSPIANSWQNAKTNGLPDGGVWRYRRTRPLTEFIPVRPRVLHDMIRGWVVGRLLGIISKPNQNGVAISHPSDPYGLTSSQFIWPTLAHSHSPNLHEKTKSVLPGLLESIGLAYVLYPTEPTVVEAFEHLASLGQNSSSVLIEWINSGTLPYATSETPAASGPDAHARKESVISVLSRNKEQYVEDIQFDPRKDDDLNKLPFGFELAHEIVEVINELIQTASEAQSNTTDF